MVGSGGASGSSSGGWWWWWWQWRWWGHTRTFAHRRVAALHAYAIVQVGPNLQSEGVAAVPSQPGSAALSGTAPVGPHGGAGRGGGGGSHWSTIFFMSGNLRTSTTGLPASSCHLQPPCLHFGQVGTVGSDVGLPGVPAEQLHRCQPSAPPGAATPSQREGGRVHGIVLHGRTVHRDPVEANRGQGGRDAADLVHATAQRIRESHAADLHRTLSGQQQQWQWQWQCWWWAVAVTAPCGIRQARLPSGRASRCR